MIRATHAPEGARGLPHGPPSVRYDVQAAWPGITGPFDARCATCSWAYHNGVYQVKYRDAGCMVHRRAVHGG